MPDSTSEFTDVTLATKDHFQIRAHKVILSASSPIFQNILTNNPHSNPLIYFNNLKSAEVKLLLKFIYLGQCEVGQDGLIDFLAAGKELMVKGLAEEKTIDNQDSFIDQNALKNQNLNNGDIELRKKVEENNVIGDLNRAFENEESKITKDTIKLEYENILNYPLGDESSSLITEDEELHEANNQNDILEDGINIHTFKNAKTAEHFQNTHSVK